jgi:hypothetical protein
MFTVIGWPQFLVIVAILVVGFIYFQRRRP